MSLIRRSFHAAGLCPFRCVGCSAGASKEHEQEALAEHLRLILAAVVELRDQIPVSDSPLLRPQLSPPHSLADTSECVPDLPRDQKEAERPMVAHTEGFSADRVALSSEVAAADATNAMPPPPSKARLADKIPDDARCAPMRQDTGQDELLLLLQSTQAPLVEVLHPVPPPGSRTAESRSRSRSPPAPTFAPGAPHGYEDPPPVTGASAAVPPPMLPSDPLAEIPLEHPLPPPKVLLEPCAEVPPKQPLPEPRLLSEADGQKALNAATAQLAEGRLSHSEAAETFSELISALPPGKLRCSALLNRAHCFVGLGDCVQALSDIDAIIEGEPAPGLEIAGWHKVWMSRGGIHRKLAQSKGGDATLFEKAREDYSRVLRIEPPNASYIAKAQKCLQQLQALEGSANFAGDRTSGAPGAAAVREEGSPKRRRLKRGPSRDAILANNEPSPPKNNDAGSGSQEMPATTPVKICALDHLRAIGRDCAAAGRALFVEGAVRERSDRAEPRHLRRVFDIQSPLGGARETVILATSGALLHNGSRVGVCTCRLRVDCKHVAAALCALEREERGCDSAALSPLGSAAQGAPGAVRPFDAAGLAHRELVERRLERRTMDELKNFLRLNDQFLGGTKPDLLRRVADGAAFGALPHCPQCGGHLHPQAGGAPGFECRRSNREKEPCGYEVLHSELLRRPFIGAENIV